MSYIRAFTSTMGLKAGWLVTSLTRSPSIQTSRPSRMPSLYCSPVRISQPSISAAIARLEADLKVPLFVRHHAKGLSLTLSGDRLLVQARGLLAHARELEQFAGAMGGAQRGEVSAGCFITLAPFLLPGLLARFAARYPEIALNIEEGNQAEVLEDLRSGRSEVALSYAYGL